MAPQCWRGRYDGGIYFAGYAVAVLFLVSAADHFDARWIVVGSSLLGSGASLAFAGLADGFWPALATRLLGGIALADVSSPVSFCLQNAPTDLIKRAAFPFIRQAMRSAAQGSFFVAGLVDAFLAGAPRSSQPGSAHSSPLPRSAAFLPHRHDRGPLGGSWTSAVSWPIEASWPTCWGLPAIPGKCSASASGLSPAFSWTLHLPGNELDLPNPALISGLASLAGVPASIVVAELAIKWGRSRVIIATCVVSTAVCIAPAATAGGAIATVLTLLILLQITSLPT